MSVTDNVDSLNDEFNQYLLEASPTNPAVELIEYWHDSTSRYPRLAKAALTLLCLANGSCDVERTFSQLRYVQRPDRSRMETDMLRMQMIMHQHRRLMMAVCESGIWMRSSSAEQFPPVDRSVTSVDVPLLDYLVILHAGLALSLVTVMLEILVHRYYGDRE
ncbi:hypothetical protein MTO96_050291 [Rhipicephalus appendiculatus]